MTIAVNIAHVRERIKAAAEKCGRDPAEIKLIAVSKTKSVEEILEATDAGQLTFGENYAQEMRDKVNLLRDARYEVRLPAGGVAGGVPEWHFIGHLQKNKIKYVLPVAQWIHTIDSINLLNDIGKKLANQQTSKQVNCLIEVNIANEPNKSGISPEKVFELVRAFSEAYKLENLSTYQLALKGLMCMPPLSTNPETSRPYFQKLKNLLDEINSRNICPKKLTELSMGMTQDFEVAIEEGATMVRIGAAIFGERR